MRILAIAHWTVLICKWHFVIFKDFCSLAEDYDFIIVIGTNKNMMHYNFVFCE